MPTRILIFALALFATLGVVSIFSHMNSGIYDSEFSLHLEDKEISLIVVNTAESMTHGLSGWESLDDNQAMLFVFNEADNYGIWMKDMKFSIDIFWLNEKKEIIHIENDVSPETYPKAFFPPGKSLYVLEANAGFAKKNNLKVGKVLNFTQN